MTEAYEQTTMRAKHHKMVANRLTNDYVEALYYH